MLAEAITAIATLAARSAALTTAPIAGDPERLIVSQNGGHEIILVPFIAPKRRVSVETFEAFGRAYETYSRREAWLPAPTGEPSDATAVIVRDPGPPGATVWVDQRKIMFYYDESDRRELCRLELDTTDVWDTLQRLGESATYQHKGLVRLLRHDLANVVDPRILAAFRTLDMEAMQRAVSVQQHGKQSLDSQVTTQVLGDDKPEGFIARFPVFVNPELRGFLVTVAITVDIDAAAKLITLQAVPDALAIALDDSLENVASRISSDLPVGTVILRGTPE